MCLYATTYKECCNYLGFISETRYKAEMRTAITKQAEEMNKQACLLHRMRKLAYNN